MDPHDLTPPGPSPHVDPVALRERVRARNTEMRRRSVRRVRAGLGILVVVVAAGGVAGLRSSDRGDSDARTTDPMAASTSVGPDPSQAPPDAGGCAPSVSVGVPASIAGLDIDLTIVQGGDDHPSARVAVTNLGPGPVTVTSATGGVNVVGLDASGAQSRGGDMRERNAVIERLDEGDTTELEGHVHATACGTRRQATTYVAMVPYLRGEGGAAAFALSEPAEVP